MNVLFQIFLTLYLIVLFIPDAKAEDDWGSSYNLLVKKTINQDWFLLSRSNLATRNDNEQLFLDVALKAAHGRRRTEPHTITAAVQSG